MPSPRARGWSWSPTCTIPSSQLTSNDTLQRIGDAALRVGARVIVDEVYLDAVFADPAGHRRAPRPGVRLHEQPHQGLRTVRRSGAAGCWPTHRWCERIRRLNDLYGNVQPFAMDWLAAAAFDRLPFLHRRTRDLLDGNRELFAAWAAGRDDIAFTATDWGTTVCVRPTRMDAERLCTELRDAPRCLGRPRAVLRAAGPRANLAVHRARRPERRAGEDRQGFSSPRF